jgi:hypothetical protein
MRAKSSKLRESRSCGHAIHRHYSNDPHPYK